MIEQRQYALRAELIGDILMPGQHFFLPEAFKISYDDIDEEHEEIVRQLNSCAENAVDGKLYSFQERFDQLIEYLGAHFDNEEVHMQSLKYDGLDWHHEHHQSALLRSRRLLDRACGWGYADMLLIEQFFVDVIYDIAKADLKFREFLDGKGLIPDAT